MSNWTHVAAIVRIDGFPWQDVDFEAVFGRTLRFEDGRDIWEDADVHPGKYLPMGSEGSLEMSVWKNPDSSCLARYTVSIFGDLRDHDDAQAVVDWFKKKTKEIMFLRSAVITVSNEWQGKTLVWVWGDDNGDS